MQAERGTNTDEARMGPMNPDADYGTGRLARPMEHKVQGQGVSEDTMVDDSEEPRAADQSDHAESGVEPDMITQVETLPFGTRLRMILLLSLACWAVVAAGVALVAR